MPEYEDRVCEKCGVTFSAEERLVSKARRMAPATSKSLNQLVVDYLHMLVRGDDAERWIEEFRSFLAEAIRADDILMAPRFTIAGGFQL